MSYNFTDDPSPDLPTFIDGSGNLQLTDGSPQGDFITASFGGTSVTITIIPPDGWTLDSVEWNTGNGTYPIPDPGNVDTYTFEVQVSQGTNEKGTGGIFRIKKAGG